MAHIIEELTLPPRELAARLGDMMEREKDLATLHVLGHAYAIISTLATISPGCYPTTWNDHMNNVIELNRVAELLITRDRQQQTRITAMGRRIEELRAELAAARQETDAMHRTLLGARGVGRTKVVPS